MMEPSQDRLKVLFENNEYVGWDIFNSNPLGSYEQSNFSQLIAKLKVFITELNRKIPPYIFIFFFSSRDRVGQKVPD